MSNGGKLGTGTDAPSWFMGTAFIFIVYIDIATCEAMIHHPSIRQHLGDSESQIVLAYFLLPPLPASVPASWRSVS